MCFVAATENVDYVFSELMLTLGPTARSADININILEDSVVEPSEQFSLRLSLSPVLFSGLSQLLIVTILDNDGIYCIP